MNPTNLMEFKKDLSKVCDLLAEKLGYEIESESYIGKEYLYNGILYKEVVKKRFILVPIKKSKK